LVAASVLGTGGAIRGGSSPLPSTTFMSIQLITLIIATLFFLVCFVLYLLFFIGTLITDAPLVLIRSTAVTQIINALQLQNNSVFYDLGCGNGRILIASLKKNPSKCIGIDYSPLAYIWARFNTKKYTQIRIRYQNVFDTDVRNATHVFVYLFPKAMERLETHFDAQLQKGTRVVSCDFKFPNKTAKETIDISVNGNKLARNLYVYEW
jgi:SAM-dependent methyltransferase